jgi:hypothetical protein
MFVALMLEERIGSNHVTELEAWRCHRFFGISLRNVIQAGSHSGMCTRQVTIIENYVLMKV